MKKVISGLLAAACFASFSLPAIAETSGNTVNGKELAFAKWVSVGDGAWEQNEEGIIAPREKGEWAMLSYNQALGDVYTVDFQVKQPDANDSIKIGFEVEEGDNFTQSGLVLELHNAGVSRIYNWEINTADENALGGCNNGYGGGQGFSKTTDWIDVKIQRTGDDFTVTLNDGESRSFSFQNGDYNGGHLVLGAVNNREILYRNIRIQSEAVKEEEIVRPDVGNTLNGETIPFSDWINAGEGSWKELDGQVLTPDELEEWLLLRYKYDLGNTFTVEFDVLQPDQENSIMIGFAVNPEDNFTQSGLVLDLHNAGVARVFDWGINAEDESAYGGCNNGFGGTKRFNGTTDWVHVRIQKDGDSFEIEFDDGSGPQTFQFSEEGYDGGFLVLGANPGRQLQYKNITITAEVKVPQTGSDTRELFWAGTALVLSLIAGLSFLVTIGKKRPQ